MSLSSRSHSVTSRSSAFSSKLPSPRSCSSFVLGCCSASLVQVNTRCPRPRVAHTLLFGRCAFHTRSLPWLFSSTSYSSEFKVVRGCEPPSPMLGTTSRKCCYRLRLYGLSKKHSLFHAPRSYPFAASLLLLVLVSTFLHTAV